MKTDEEILIRLTELISEGDKILMSAETIAVNQGGRRNFATRQYTPPKTKYRKVIDKDLAIKWKTSCLHFLEIEFGNGHHLQNFSEVTKSLNFETVRSGLGVLSSAKESLEKGYNQKPENKILENNIEEKTDLISICDEEAKRNTTIYLIIILVFVIFLALALNNFGIIYATSIPSGLLIIGYCFSAFSLKEWTPSKLHERILELEKERIYKRFGVNLEEE